MEANQTVEFKPLKGFEHDYEILSVYPFTIRRKDNHYVIKDTFDNSTGYIKNYLNRKKYLKHRLIALQFLPNDDPINNDVIDHIDHNRSNNHLSNLRWCSSSNNNYNKSSHFGIQYEYVDDIPDDALVVDFYDTRTERREFEQNKYYYWFNEETNEDVFYSKIEKDIYKILHINTNKSGNQFVQLRDVNNRICSVMINRFKQQHDLL